LGGTSRRDSAVDIGGAGDMNIIGYDGVVVWVGDSNAGVILSIDVLRPVSWRSGNKIHAAYLVIDEQLGLEVRNLHGRYCRSCDVEFLRVRYVEAFWRKLMDWYAETPLDNLYNAAKGASLKAAAGRQYIPALFPADLPSAGI
jgi:hypothetical protein